jgi:hypothetical protein
MERSDYNIHRSASYIRAFFYQFYPYILFALSVCPSIQIQVIPVPIPIPIYRLREAGPNPCLSPPAYRLSPPNNPALPISPSPLYSSTSNARTLPPPITWYLITHSRPIRTSSCRGWVWDILQRDCLCLSKHWPSMVSPPSSSQGFGVGCNGQVYSLLAC